MLIFKEGGILSLNFNVTQIIIPSFCLVQMFNMYEQNKSLVGTNEKEKLSRY